MALIASRFLPQAEVTNPSKEDVEKFAAPLPTTFVPTIKDKAENYVLVKENEATFGFQYSSAVGMLIFLWNTAIVLHFGIRNLAKFNTLPGENHYKALIHLLNHIRCWK